MLLSTIFLAAAVICFTLGAFGVPARVNWTDAGFAFVAAALLVGRIVVG